MQDADVQALAWAVRRELDICLADLSNTTDGEGLGPTLEQVRVRQTRSRKCMLTASPCQGFTNA